MTGQLISSAAMGFNSLLRFRKGQPSDVYPICDPINLLLQPAKELTTALLLPMRWFCVLCAAVFLHC